jgi:hypothetical protein
MTNILINNNWKLIQNILIILVILIISSIFYKLINNNTITIKDNYTLKNNGFEIFNLLDDNDINTLNILWNNKQYDEMKKTIHNNNKLLKIIKENLGDNYIFQDYMYLIEKSRIHTCHRDNNSKFFNKYQKHNSYTILIFIDHMDNCLDVIPNSNNSKNGIFLTDITLSIKCNIGNIIIFDASLIHSGSFNKKPNNKRIQMKISHKDDIKILSYYEKYDKKLNKENILSNNIINIQKHLSCQFPILSDIMQPLVNDISKKDKNYNIPLHQKIFSKIFYGDTHFYNLSNI